jgi:hypothetical protein
MAMGMMSPPDVKRRATAYASIFHTLSNSRVFANAGLGFQDSCFRFRISEFGFRIWGLGFGVWGLGSGV